MRRIIIYFTWLLIIFGNVISSIRIELQTYTRETLLDAKTCATVLARGAAVGLQNRKDILLYVCLRIHPPPWRGLCCRVGTLREYLVSIRSAHGGKCQAEREHPREAIGNLEESTATEQQQEEEEIIVESIPRQHHDREKHTLTMMCATTARALEPFTTLVGIAF